MSNLEIKTLTRESAGFTKLEEVFVEAFPPEEVNLPFGEYVALSEHIAIVHALEIADGDIPMGLFLYVDADGYSYLNYFAVDANQRGKGYGQRALTKLLEFFGDKPLIGDIERPIEGAEGYDIKLRRQKFYERNGFLVSEEPFSWDDAEYLIISNRSDYLNPEYIFRLKKLVASSLESDRA